MKKYIKAIAFTWLLALTSVGTHAVIQGSGASVSLMPRPADSLRIGEVIKGLHALQVELKDSILPQLKDEERDELKKLLPDLKSGLSEAKKEFKDTMMTDFSALNETEKKLIIELEGTVNKMKSALSGASVAFHKVAMAHLPVYKVRQELRSDGRTPLLATYWYPYDPNTTDNNQVILTGAYLNYYLEYRIRVGGIELGPDIVDPGRLVFTFPEQLLNGKTEPFWVEVTASPKKMVLSDKGMSIQDHVGQHCYLLVFPRKK